MRSISSATRSGFAECASRRDENTWSTRSETRRVALPRVANNTNSEPGRVYDPSAIDWGAPDRLVFIHTNATVLYAKPHAEHKAIA